MKETERLKAKLAKLVEESGDSDAMAGRTLAPADPGGLLFAIVQEIDETILARELVFSNDRQEQITLEVSGRRLLRITSIPQLHTASSFNALVDRQISDPDGSEIDTITELLAVFVEHTATLRVKTRPLQLRHGQPDLGCSSEVLAAACARRSGSLSQESLEDFCAASAEFAIAWVQLREGTVVKAAGDPEIARKLTYLAQSHDPWPPVDWHLRGKESAAKGCTVLCGSDDGSDILVAVQDDRALFMAFAPERLAHVVALWFSPSGHLAR